jgi:prophage endopeptidase
MNRTEFVLTTAIILFVAFAMGWFANWLLHKFTRVSKSDLSEFEKMAQELHEAEETRDQAITYLQQREAELTSKLTQTEAELNAAMDGLRQARLEAEELRTLINHSSNAKT